MNPAKFGTALCQDDTDSAHFRPLTSNGTRLVFSPATAQPNVDIQSMNISTKQSDVNGSYLAFIPSRKYEP